MPSNLVVLVQVACVFLVLFVLVMTISSRVANWRQREQRLRLLTGTPSQRAALKRALAPVARAFLPQLDKAGHDVRQIVVVPTLSGGDGEPLAAEVEELGGSGTFMLLLAHRLGDTLCQPDEVAGVLAEDLLYLYRQAAAVNVVRQTRGAVAGQTTPAAMPISPRAIPVVPKHPSPAGAEETVVQFKPSPLDRNHTHDS